MPIHLRQSLAWSSYMHTLGWQTETINQNQISIRPLPLIKKSLIKIQRPNYQLTPTILDQLAKQHNALSVIIEPPLHDINNAELQKSGWRQSKTSFAQSGTMHLDLSKPETAVFASFSENARRQIKKAQKNNLHFKTVPFDKEFNESAFDHFWSLWENLCNMKHFYKLSKTEMHNKMTALATSSYLIFAYPNQSLHDSPPIAVVWYVVYDSVIYYLHTGITQRGYDQQANYALVWEGIKLGQQHNCTLFDFEGIYDYRLPKSTQRWRGFTEFKSRFHGQKIYYPLPLVKHYHPVFSAIHFLGELLSPA